MDKTVTINETNYDIRIHPGELGLELAYELNRLVGTAVYMSQQAVSSVLDSLTDEEKKALAEGSEEEKTQKYMDLIVPKISPEKMMEAAIVMLRDLKPKDMMQLTKGLFAGIQIDGKPLNMNTHFAGKYANIIPLMGEVIKFNGFLELDATDLLRL